MLRCLDHACKVDTGNHREPAHDRSLAGERKAVFVVQAGPIDADGDVAVHQVLLVEIGEADRLPLVGLANEDRSEGRHRLVSTAFPVQEGRPAPQRSANCILARDPVDTLRRTFMLPCGSLLKTTTKSVPLPVSELSASSEMIREERGDTIPAIRSNASGGMTIRSSAVFAPPRSADIGSTSRPRPPRGPATPPCGRSPCNETTLHRMSVSRLARSMAVKTCVPIGRSASRIVTGLSAMG